ncbi:MAG: DUF4131 domain-containing protein, partial [Elusimicrobia bacterium]|nr:DUF4131 domain-containing protein [Elusimicrobiota bacterium]
MRASHLKRPLAWGLALYASALGCLWHTGFFRVVPPAELAAWVGRPEVVVDGTLLSGVTPKRPGDRYWLRAEAAGGRPTPPAKVLLYLHRGSPQGPLLRPGQRVRLCGKLRRPVRPRNPGDFDEASFLDMRGAGLVLHARSVLILAPPPWRWLPWAWGESVHLSIDRWLKARLDA